MRTRPFLSLLGALLVGLAAGTAPAQVPPLQPAEGEMTLTVDEESVLLHPYTNETFQLQIVASIQCVAQSPVEGPPALPTAAYIDSETNGTTYVAVDFQMYSVWVVDPYRLELPWTRDPDDYWHFTLNETITVTVRNEYEYWEQASVQLWFESRDWTYSDGCGGDGIRCCDARSSEIQLQYSPERGLPPEQFPGLPPKPPPNARQSGVGSGLVLVSLFGSLLMVGLGSVALGRFRVR